MTEERSFEGDAGLGGFEALPLVEAAAAGDLRLVEALLSLGAAPDGRPGDGCTPLHAAVESDEGDSLAVMARLIAAGANLHGADVDGRTPLHLAAARGSEPKARLLLDAGAEVDRRPAFDGQETPLMEAARVGRPEAVPLLLERGAATWLLDPECGRYLDARRIAQDAGRGYDPGVYAVLKRHPVPLDVDEMLDGLGLEAGSLGWLREALGSYDAAETYRRGADRIAREGRHAEVVRLLDEHEASLGWPRRWRSRLRRWLFGEIRLGWPRSRPKRPEDGGSVDAPGS